MNGAAQTCNIDTVPSNGFTYREPCSTVLGDRPEAGDALPCDWDLHWLFAADFSSGGKQPEMGGAQNAECGRLRVLNKRCGRRI
jgi:hypothetical protein